MNRNFLITGAAQGMGLQFTRRALLGNGRVVMADLAKEEGEKAAKELEKEFGVGKVCFVHLDVRDEAMWRSAWDQAEQFFGGQVQVLMNNAGVFNRTNWRLMLDVNLGGLATGTILGIEKMGTSRGGQGGLIFQTASLASLVTGGFNNAEEEMYTATKWAILGWTRSMGKHETWVKEKVRMVAVCPWLVNTNLVQSQINTMEEDEKSKIAEKMNTWVHRLIEPEDVAKAVEQAIVHGDSGDVLTVGPGVVYYYPDIQKMVFLVYKVIHTILVTTGWVPSSQAVTVNQIGAVFGLILLGLALLFHFLLRFVGL